MQDLREHARVPAADDIPIPPNADELPDSDGIPMDSERQVAQMNLLGQPLKRYWQNRPDAYVGMNMFVYFSADRRFDRDFRGPDVFVALGVRPGERRRWAVWLELKAPDVVIEVLSDSTRTIDMTEKKQVYQDYLRVPEYFWYDPFTGERAGWVLRDGRFEEIAPDEADRLPSRVTELTLVRWHGVFQGIEATWLRWATADGTLLPTADELVETAEAEVARERQRVADLEARLAELERRQRDDQGSA